jgi:hypothetical protein
MCEKKISPGSRNDISKFNDLIAPGKNNLFVISSNARNLELRIVISTKFKRCYYVCCHHGRWSGHTLLAPQ